MGVLRQQGRKKKRERHEIGLGGGGMGLASVRTLQQVGVVGYR